MLQYICNSLVLVTYMDEGTSKNNLSNTIIDIYMMECK